MDYVRLREISESNIDDVAQDFGWESSEDMLQDLGAKAEELYDLYMDEMDPLSKELFMVGGSGIKELREKNITLFTIVNNKIFTEKAVANVDNDFAYIESERYYNNILGDILS